ncbi:MAG: hypothetical protein ACKOSS_09225 [Planctomycetia bacterium]
MSWVRATLAWLGLLLLAACGGGLRLTQDDCGVPTSIRVVQVDTLPEGRVGQTDRCAQGGTLVELRSDSLGGIYGIRLAAHELAHAAGFSGHLGDPDCILYEVSFDLLPPPCPQELAYMQSVVGPLLVTDSVTSRPGLVQAAMDYWNQSLGRALFLAAP